MNPPLPPEKGARPRSPLQYAIESGFHSLVQVLLEGGAEIERNQKYDALSRVLWNRRFDMVRLLVENGANAKSVDMNDVFSTWQPDIMEYFIERGADVDTGNPLAQALCSRIRTALKIAIKYKARFPSFQQQINIALRYHCKEGNMKWISLMVWAGADLYASGPVDPEHEEDAEDGISALEYAALYEHYDVFRMRQIRIDPKHPAIASAIRYAHGENASALITYLLECGVNPNDQSNGGCSAIQNLLSGLGYSFSLYSSARQRNVDTPESREKIKIIHILAKSGAKWIPNEDDHIRHARYSLLRAIPDYTAEFVWIMSKYHACSRKNLEELLRTPSMRAHISPNSERVSELISCLE
ncbi:MAG: ankyrin repeat domain-containing protein [Kiritimatiellae bacterium]|nr:ankyrin repeat domain-containing protein [Kiritimatiellia bacterium]